MGIFIRKYQKQRISIARAFVRNPKILILDEDFCSGQCFRKKIQDSIQRLVRDRTTLIVASIVYDKNADKIAVIEMVEC